MKPARFEYASPSSVGEVVSLLSGNEDAKILAGGQSLVPTMNFRLARPALLVDINRVKGLDTLEVEGDELRIGALVRHSAFEKPVVEDPLGRLLSLAARYVGHLPIRVRGTFVGSIAHADPAAEWCLIARMVDAQMVATSPRGERVIPADSFFQSVFTTALEPDELLTEVRLPLLGSNAKVGFSEFSRRAGDFAIVSAGVVTLVDGGRIAEARIGLGGSGSTPERASRAEAALVGNAPSEEVFSEAATIAREEVEPMGDIHASAEYRQHLASVLVRRALAQTLETRGATS